MKTGILAQVRLDSSRLYRKALLELGDKTVVELVMSALNLVEADERVLVTAEDSYDELKPYAEAYGFHCFPGSKNDVLDRYLQAADHFGIDTIIRATGDNPLVSYELANMAIKSHFESKADYTGFTGMPLGMGVEVVQTESLFQAGQSTTLPYDREHVTPFIYKNSDLFNVNRPSAPAEWVFPTATVTLDTWLDYQFLYYLFNELYTGEPVNGEKLMAWLRKEMINNEKNMGRPFLS